MENKNWLEKHLGAVMTCLTGTLIVSYFHMTHTNNVRSEVLNERLKNLSLSTQKISEDVIRVSDRVTDININSWQKTSQKDYAESIIRALESINNRTESNTQKIMSLSAQIDSFHRQLNTQRNVIHDIRDDLERTKKN